MNVAALFDTQARTTPGALALSWDGGEMSYGPLRERARRMATRISERGVAVGDRVAVLLPNSPDFAVALLGILWRGATAAVLSPAWAVPDAVGALERANVTLLVTTRALAHALGAPPESTLIVDEPAAEHMSTGETDPMHRASSDAATILFSSGTTGDPKGVVLTHGNLVFNARAKIGYCGIAANDRLAMVVPMAHCFGQNVVLLGALLAGASVRIFSRFDAGGVLGAIERGEVTMLLAAPTAFERLLGVGDERPLRRLRYALTAAAPLPGGLAERWREASGRPLAQGYGLTESSPFATYEDSATTSGGGVGSPIAGVEVRAAVPGRDEWVQAGSPGEIVIRGPNVMQGYWRQPAATARALRGGWLRTGDFGVVRPDGVVELIDRLDDVINVGGFKAWPSDVERVVGAHPAVREAVAYAVPDPLRGSTVGIAVVLERGATFDSEMLSSHVRSGLAGFQRPTTLRIVDELPRSASGKVLRRELAR